MIKEDIEAREKFLFVLDWLLAIRQRHAETISFGLAHINYGQHQVLGEAYGAQEASRKLVDVSMALRRGFRKTDLIARDGLDFWILVPYMRANEKLSDKLKEIVEIASKSGLDIVERDVSIYALPTDDMTAGENCSALEMLARLKAENGDRAMLKFSLPAESES
jgi:hypothetical protein